MAGARGEAREPLISNDQQSTNNPSEWFADNLILAKTAIWHGTRANIFADISAKIILTHSTQCYFDSLD
jgi:hypothetical protein